MGYYVGLDLSLKATRICVVDETGCAVWEGVADTHPEMIADRLARFSGELALVGLETGSITPWLYRSLKGLGLPVVCMDARRAADAVKARSVKTDKADARALAEMLQTGWYGEVHVKSEDSHRHRALLGARDQLVTNKRMLCGQIRGLLRPFGITVKARMGCKRFDETARACCAHDDLLYACVSALLEALGAIESQVAALDTKVREIVRTSKPCWHLMSVPGVGPVTALSFMATIEDPRRFGRSRDVGAYLGLTPRRYQSGERDISAGFPPGRRDDPALSLRGRQLSADDSARILTAQELGIAVDEAGRRQEGPHRAGPQDGGTAVPHMERGDPLRRMSRQAMIQSLT